jgi:pimeloyl-ACP methyl ester carboxylesterase
MRGKVIIVGHSLGALVAVEIAKRYPRSVRSIILCSPPFYLPASSDGAQLPRTEAVLKSIYKTIYNHPEKFMKIVAPAIKYKLLDKAHTVSEENLYSYVEALESAIINQTSYSDVLELTLPIIILYGTLDPVVRLKTLKQIVTANRSAKLVKVIASHEIRKTYRVAVVKEINQHLED